MRAHRVFGILLVAALIAGSAAFAVQLRPRASLAQDASPVAAQCPTEFPTGTLQIMAPAAPGGGWDTTAREMARVLQENVVNQPVEVFNVPGAGGTVGLAQLANEHRGDDHTLMMMGLVMVGAIATNQSPVTLDQTTPIMRLIAEYEVIVVPADSPYQTLGDLIADLQTDPGAVTWAGGSAGGTDHILAGLIAQAVGVDPRQINYVAFSGGGEALAAVLGGQVSAGVSGLGEWQAQIEAGELRALAISAPAGWTATPVAGMATPVPGADIPTLQEQGVDVALANWRGVVAPPEISEEGRQCLIALTQQMIETDAWQEVMARNGWQPFYLAGDEYGQFLTEETERVVGVLREIGLVE